MPRSKEISEDIRRQVVEAHESGKGYKQISKVIGLPKTTIRAILRKWKRFGTVVTLPRSGRPSKISPRARREIIREVMKNPCTTSRDLQATLASSNICVHQSTIRRILGIHGRPTLSSFEGNLPLSNQEEEGMLSASCGSSQDVKVLKNSNTNSDNTSKNNAKFSDANKEGAGREENNREDENENCDDERNVGDADGGDVETKNNGAETEKCDVGGQCYAVGHRTPDTGHAAFVLVNIIRPLELKGRENTECVDLHSRLCNSVVPLQYFWDVS
ncbi:hypothetical protein QTP70_009105 [Hemibagrus guttatus]|uniref:Transposase Tc1-like domain-containing protein n=1 Tax=Hemibagrus guttatus TaxID=175788 RepID=A0AAE0PX40_9TELE|nr:hypothetical protein QTP70_009105 [Hemibagrus guttatus]